MKTVVIYKSISGFTEKYAKWIAEELNADVFKLGNISFSKLINYDTIIYGGSLVAVGINGIGFLKRNLDRLRDKKIVVFATGASPVRKEVVDEVINMNFSEDQKKKIKFFYLRGGFDFNKLDLLNKFLMLLLKVKLLLKKEKTADDRGMLSAYSHPFDATKKENIKELIDFVKS